MAGQEAEALGVLGKQHRTQIAVAQTDLAVVSDGTIDAERLQALADGGSCLSGGLDILLQRDSRAHGVRPAGILKADGLDALDDLIRVKALGLTHLAAGLHGLDAILCEDAIDLVDSSFVTFKQSHLRVLLL